MKNRGKQRQVTCPKSWNQWYNQDLNPGRTTPILYYLILSYSNVGELMDGQKNGKLFQKEYKDTAAMFMY